VRGVWPFMTTVDADNFDPRLLRALRAAPWRTIEKRFLVILVGSIAFHIALATYVAAQPMPITEEHLDALADRVSTRISLPLLLPIPKAPPVVAAGPSQRLLPEAGPTKRVNHDQVAREAVIKVLGSQGPGGVFSELLGAPVEEIAQALEGARGFEVANRLEAVRLKGPASGEVATLDRLGTAGVKAVAIGNRSDKIPSTAVPGQIVIEDPDNIDPRVLQQFITARRAAVQNCYERELHHNPSMKGGKVVLRMAIGTTGRVSGLSVEEDTLGSAAVTACMSTLMQRWIFPVTPREEVPLSVPFVFARAN
jgi:hypothetical protein